MNQEKLFALQEALRVHQHRGYQPGNGGTNPAATLTYLLLRGKVISLCEEHKEKPTAW